MPKEFNPFSTGLADIISRHADKIQSAVKICQPFNDFEKDVNQDLIVTVKLSCEAMVRSILAHEQIHEEWLEGYLHRRDSDGAFDLDPVFATPEDEGIDD